MTSPALHRTRHGVGIGLAACIGLVIALLWVWVVPWIEQTELAEFATLVFVGLAALILSLGEMLWTRLYPSSH